jgi:hypothetical protein
VELGPCGFGFSYGWLRCLEFGLRWEVCAAALYGLMGDSGVRICGAVEFRLPPSPGPCEVQRPVGVSQRDCLDCDL